MAALGLRGSWALTVAFGVALAQACGGGAPNFGAASAAPSESSATPETVPAATAAPTTLATLPIDQAGLGFGGLSWSPDGALLAAIAYPAGDLGAVVPEVRIYRPDGSRVAAVAGDHYAWLDAATLAVLVIDRTGGALEGTATVAIYGADGHRIRNLQGSWGQSMFGGVVANGRGIVALLAADGSGSRLWSERGGLSPPFAGIPAAWSPDGTKLAVFLPPKIGRVEPFVLANTGGVQPGTMEVLDAASLAVLASFPDDPLDNRFAPFWSPAGAWIAGDGGGPPYALTALPIPGPGEPSGRTVERLAGAAVPLGWTADGRLIHAGNPLRAWDPRMGDAGDVLWAATARADPCGGRLSLDHAGRGIAELSANGMQSLQRASGEMAVAGGQLACECANENGPVGGLLLAPIKTMPQVP